MLEGNDTAFGQRPQPLCWGGGGAWTFGLIVMGAAFGSFFVALVVVYFINEVCCILLLHSIWLALPNSVY